MPADDDAPSLPCAQALLAATLALMTAYPQPAPDARLAADALQRLMARRIVSNLFFLKAHPAVPAGLRQVLEQAHAHWVPRAEAPGAVDRCAGGPEPLDGGWAQPTPPARGPILH